MVLANEVNVKSLLGFRLWEIGVVVTGVIVNATVELIMCLQVRELDWVEQVWPKELKLLQTNPTNDLKKMMYPKVQKYVLFFHVLTSQCMNSLVHH